MQTVKMAYRRFRVVVISALIMSINASQAKVSDTSSCSSAGNFSVLEGSNVTIYNQNKALIKQTRSFELEKGLNSINWDEFPSTIDIHSVSLRGPDNTKSVEVKEQNYQYEALNSFAVLSRSLGKTVYFQRYLGDGKSEEQSGILLSTDRLIKTKDRYVLNPGEPIEFDSLPSGLVSKPTITFLVKASESGKKDLLLGYEAAGINWQCDYVLNLNNAQDKLDLAAWITLDNKSGVSFSKSNLKLVAGNVNSVRPDPMPMMACRAPFAQDVADVNITENAFADYHLYTVPGVVDLNNNETKRVSFIERQSIPVEKKYIFEQQFYGDVTSKQKTPVQIKLQFQNDEKFKQPFPAGQVRVYQEDADKQLQLIGQDQIFHRAVGEKISIKLGDAFDVLGERIHINSEQTAEHRQLDTCKVTFSNHLNKDIVVSDIEHISDLAEFISDSPFTKLNSNTYQFDVKVPASGTADITYQIKSRK